MIIHYLLNNNKTCYSDFSPNFSRTKRGLKRKGEGERKVRGRRIRITWGCGPPRCPSLWRSESTASSDVTRATGKPALGAYSAVPGREACHHNWHAMTQLGLLQRHTLNRPPPYVGGLWGEQALQRLPPQLPLYTGEFQLPPRMGEFQLPLYL